MGCSLSLGSSASLSNLQMGDEICWINGQTMEGATRQKLLTHVAKGDKIGSLLLKIRRYSRRQRTSSYNSDDMPPPVEDNQVFQAKGGLAKPVEFSDDKEVIPLPPSPVVMDTTLDESAGGKGRIQERERNGKRKPAVCLFTSSFCLFVRFPSIQ